MDHQILGGSYPDTVWFKPEIATNAETRQDTALRWPPRIE